MTLQIISIGFFVVSVSASHFARPSWKQHWRLTARGTHWYNSMRTRLFGRCHQKVTELFPGSSADQRHSDLQPLLPTGRRISGLGPDVIAVNQPSFVFQSQVVATYNRPKEQVNCQLVGHQLFLWGRSYTGRCSSSCIEHPLVHQIECRLARQS